MAIKSIKLNYENITKKDIRQKKKNDLKLFCLMSRIESHF